MAKLCPEANIEFKKKMNIKFPLLVVLLVFLASCSKRNLVYFSDLPGDLVTSEKISQMYEPTIQPADNISVSITTLNLETNQMLNIGSDDGFIVDNSGHVNFPILGKVFLKGLTIEEAADKLTQIIEKEVKNPIVSIKITNFNFTILGEVSSPNTYTVPSGKINILEAIGLAGDLTSYGKRENILLIRERDGVRITARLDLNKKEIFSSPYFYLQQNDIIYVESAQQKEEKSNIFRSNLSLTMSVISFLLLIYLEFK